MTCFICIALHCRPTTARLNTYNHLDKLLSGASAVLLVRDNTDELDRVSYFMGGVVIIDFWGRRIVFDLTHWVLSVSTSSLSPIIPTEQRQKKTKWKKYPRVEAACGLVYVFMTMFGSISYLQLSQTNLSNDFFWAGLNATGIHPALMTWFRDQWIYNDLGSAVVSLDNVSLLGNFGDVTSVEAPASMGSQAQMTLLSTPTQAITGLRGTKDVCDMPWMFTQYCYVDFQQTWSLANSAKRALRCSKMTANGAIYLEAIVRNINWPAFQACWGDAFDKGIAEELRTTTAGKLWLTQNLVLDGFSTASIADEVNHWNKHQITRFNIQWQNYRKVGIVHTYNIIGALSNKTPFTIQSDSCVDNRHSQTSMKLYWAFANDLNLITANSSHASSLVRGSSNFVFENTSIATIMAGYGYVNSPLSAGLTAVKKFFGPFGSIDTFYVPCPSEVRAAFLAIGKVLNDAMRQNTKAQSSYMNIKLCAYITPAPERWMNDYSYGGTLLCDQSLHPNPIKQSLLALFSRDEICRRGDAFVTILRPNRPQLITATMMANLLDPATNLTAICNLDLYNGGNICIGYLSATISFIQTYFKSISELDILAAAATDAINKLDIRFMQYGAVNTTSPIEIYHIPLLAEPHFRFFSWLFIYQWVLGNREVISFQGDSTELTLLSEILAPSVQVIDTSELPINFATYARSGVFYVTGVLLAVSFGVVVYAGASRGFIEARNLLEVNRVGGIVWVGRPLLALRSLTALLLLSTATLDLKADGILAVFNVMAMPWYKTLLSAAEVTWLVYIMNDIAIVITVSYTKYYAPINSILMWLITGVMTLLSPVEHKVVLEKSCSYGTGMPWDIICSSGTIEIGQMSRLVTLVGLVIGLNCLCYLFIHCTVKRIQVTELSWISGGAKYLFDVDSWYYGNVYFLDRSSAILDGIITWHWGDKMHAFDVKTWRLLPLKRTCSISYEKSFANASKYALPLDD
ncbi:hypothetical protein THRCLA_20921 [Thraustotheca clavata]|uniref:Uncharacterized protein n=1 Tax=Thraustotheca clavata TaxID=74557 RepID=A0A1W0A1Z1_9STRA|nr:hypothetical protein THRCLA_20921 [Thraustotheca clavata]